MSEHEVDSVLKLLDDPEALRLFVNDSEEIYLEKKESFELTGAKLTGSANVMTFLQSLGQLVGRAITASDKVVNFRLSDGKRVSSFHPPGATSPLICISR